MADLQNTKAQLVYRTGDSDYERVNPLTLADIVQMEESQSGTAENIINYINNELAKKANKATTISGYGITDAYTKTETDEKFAEKATTLAGYGITDAYTKLEVDGKIAELINFRVEVVQSLPPQGQTNVLYLVPKEGTGSDVYDEYIWIVNGNVGHYEFIGTTQVDLSNYYTKGEADNKFAVKATTLAGYGITDAYTKEEVNTALSGKQDDLQLSESNINAIKDLAYSNHNVGQMVSGTFKKFLKDGDADILPSQAGHAGEFLKTDGTDVSWDSVDAFPDQTNNQGKALFTDGEEVSWEKPSFSTEITLTALGWDAENKQVVRVNGMGIDDIILVNPKPTIDGVNESIYSSCKVRAIDQYPNQLTFYCDTIPSDDLIVTIGVVRIKEYLNVVLSVDQDDASIETWITETNPEPNPEESSS